MFSLCNFARSNKTCVRVTSWVGFVTLGGCESDHISSQLTRWWSIDSSTCGRAKIRFCKKYKIQKSKKTKLKEKEEIPPFKIHCGDPQTAPHLVEQRFTACPPLELYEGIFCPSLGSGDISSLDLVGHFLSPPCPDTWGHLAAPQYQTIYPHLDKRSVEQRFLLITFSWVGREANLRCLKIWSMNEKPLKMPKA